MRKRLCLSIIVAAAAVAIGGCSRSQTDNGKIQQTRVEPGEMPAQQMTDEEARSAEAVLNLSLKSAHASAKGGVTAAVVPVLKPGLWSVTYQRQEMGFSETRRICVDAALAARLAELPANADPVTCTTHDVIAEDDAVRVETVCKRNDTTLTSHIVIRSPSDTEFHQTMETIYTPAYAGHADAHMTADGLWLAECPAGMKPGATTLAGKP